MREIILFVFIVFLSCLKNSNGQRVEYSMINKNEKPLSHLDSVIVQQMDDKSVVGLSLAIFTKDGVLYEKGYGFRDIYSKDSININTIFEAASLSKPVFAYAVLKLASKGIIDLDKPLYSYYVDLDIKDNPDSRLITPRIILQHSTGFPNWSRNRKLKMSYKPGTEFKYSGEAYFYLQKAVEKITGKSIEKILHEEVFKPLQMNYSSFIWKETFDENYAHGHKSNKKYTSKWKPKSVNVAASLHTTSVDYAKFLVAILNEAGLSKEMSGYIFKPQIETNKRDIYWSLGFGLEKVNEDYYLWHWGHNPGFRAYFILNHRTKTGFVYLTNSDKGLKIAEELLFEITGTKNHPSLKWF